ncbi:hypothetical protein [Gordonibacter sp. Marseille-P4307]|uniref:hypothetical protein n=1 Tax=Gordonibacter sp. Marseille-P4307 TaxID=2161815 RepID=UPI0013DDA6A1|nr:hypothetical protein [Gordonibacter sp. Marseille-P4307]
METLVYAVLALILGLELIWVSFMLYTSVRDDRRDERERKERLAREAKREKAFEAMK